MTEPPLDAGTLLAAYAIVSTSRAPGRDRICAALLAARDALSPDPAPEYPETEIGPHRAETGQA